jgi:aryl-alcohol dehydrogenase-like predicted oxidoreductase
VQYVKLGSTGLDISRIGLGCMSYGEPDRGKHPWTLGEEASRPFIRQALDLGINFFDTANSYSDGSSEEIVGRALRDFAPRDEVVIATKVFYRDAEGPNLGGLSRKALFAEVDASLARLGVDYIDLYQLHRFDPQTPLEETLQALDDIVRSGRVRYVGASSMWAWQFSKALYTADLHGWTRFVSMQDHYNLLNREEEREMFPLCADQGIGVLPWSPLARGRLTRPWDEASERSSTDEFGQSLYRDDDRHIVDAVAAIAEQRGVPRAQIALAWVLRNPVVTAPLVGATKSHHLDDAVAATAITLTDDEAAALEGAYTPREPAGFA